MSKAQRHHHLNRLKHQRNRHLAVANLTDGSNFSANNNLQKHLARHLTTPKPCSCWLCGNPRKFYGNSQSAKTLQERKAINDEVYQKQHCQMSA